MEDRIFKVRGIVNKKTYNAVRFIDLTDEEVRVSTCCPAHWSGDEIFIFLGAGEDTYLRYMYDSEVEIIGGETNAK